MLEMFKADFPKMVRIGQQFQAPKVEDIPEKVRSELRRINLAAKVRPGMRVVITAGSRGVANIPVILRAVVDELREYGAEPFVIPAMGSHGGATAEGQLKVLEALGVTEESVGAPIKSSMETVEIGRTPGGIPVNMDRYAAESDGIVVVARVKAHTDFEGEIESGLHKMMVIGLGKHNGALTAHPQFISHGFENVMKEIAGTVLAKAPILAGVGTIENVYDETAGIFAALPADFYEMEKEYLVRAKALVGKIPFDEIDVLIMDEIGKDISGTGMDTKVVGRLYNVVSKIPEKPHIKRIFVRDLSKGTGGSALGIGMADFTTRRLFEKIDFRVTYVNCLTGISPENGRIPIICDDDREALIYSLSTIGAVPGPQARVVWIKNTLRLGVMYISEVMVPEARRNEHLDILGEPEPLPFDDSGNLVPFAW
ncbi:MAG: DUF362 domain-containing protein [Chloroflexi bacterium]|nr:DUF362 domain-containing protein [Chloroflexota bacterium]